MKAAELTHEMHNTRQESLETIVLPICRGLAFGDLDTVAGLHMVAVGMPMTGTGVRSLTHQLQVEEGSTCSYASQQVLRVRHEALANVMDDVLSEEEIFPLEAVDGSTMVIARFGSSLPVPRHRSLRFTDRLGSLLYQRRLELAPSLLDRLSQDADSSHDPVMAERLKIARKALKSYVKISRAYN